MYQRNVRDTEEDHLATLERISLDGGGLRADAGILELGSVLDVAELACRSVGDAAEGVEGQLAPGKSCGLRGRAGRDGVANLDGPSVGNSWSAYTSTDDHVLPTYMIKEREMCGSSEA